jgi:hypothetical protein
MGTIDEEGGFRVLIHTAEYGEPPHVHVRKGRVEVKVGLDPVRELRNRRMDLRDIKQALRLVRRKQETYLARWREIHG